MWLWGPPETGGEMVENGETIEGKWWKMVGKLWENDENTHKLKYDLSSYPSSAPLNHWLFLIAIALVPCLGDTHNNLIERGSE